MALTQQSLTDVARRKAEHAKTKLIRAEKDLAGANRTLQSVTSDVGVQEVGGVRQQTERAEQEVAEAVEELEVVTELLESPATGAASAPLPPASGQGVKSLVRHLKKVSGGSR